MSNISFFLETLFTYYTITCKKQQHKISRRKTKFMKVNSRCCSISSLWFCRLKNDKPYVIRYRLNPQNKYKLLKLKKKKKNRFCSDI